MPLGLEFSLDDDMLDLDMPMTALHSSRTARAESCLRSFSLRKKSVASSAECRSISMRAYHSRLRSRRSFALPTTRLAECVSSTSTWHRTDELADLSSRIQLEKRRVLQRTARLHGSNWLQSLARVLVPTKQDQKRLKTMKHYAEVARCRRSLELLCERRDSVQSMEDSYEDELLPGEAMSADDVLAEDSLHHVLALQTQWLQTALDWTRSRKLRNRGDKHLPLELFLRQYVDHRTGASTVPCAMDHPTLALVRFEKLVDRQQLMPRHVKRAFDRLCHETMSGTSSKLTAVWEQRDAYEALASLVDELTESIHRHALLPIELYSVLRDFVEQVVFSRLAAVCYRVSSPRLDQQNAQWRRQIEQCSEWTLEDAGLRVSDVELVDGDDVFAETIAAMDDLPHLVPSCLLSTFVHAIQVLHVEAEEALGVRANAMSMDVLLPLLVFVLSRCELPYLHSQLFLMEQSVQEASETGYYLTCLRAAVAHIMHQGQATHLRP